MTWQQIDSIFPYVVFFYGVLMVFVLENKHLQKLLDKTMPSYASQFLSHKPLAWVSFFVGGLWALQNLLVMP
jgi:hypothetical protein